VIQVASDVRTPVLCIDIDLDDLRFYRGIHALPQVPETPVVFEAAVPRFLDLCARVGAKATLFTIADDLRWDSARAALADAVRDGHEVASHSSTHRYDVSRLPADPLEREIRGAKDALEQATGEAVVGFRGPGYNLTPALLDELAASGHRYDSSILPSPPYWLARATVIGFMRATGRRSTSIVGRGRDFLRSRLPFAWPNGLAEYPITAAGPARLPLIGTTLAGDGLATRSLLACAARLPFVNVEFHAIDFLDLEGDSLEAGLGVEPALRVPLAVRLERFERALCRIARDHRSVLLRDLPGLW